MCLGGRPPIPPPPPAPPVIKPIEEPETTLNIEDKKVTDDKPVEVKTKKSSRNKAGLTSKSAAKAFAPQTINTGGSNKTYN